MIALLAAAWAAVTPADPTAAAAYTPRRVAVLIGIQDYADPALHGLRYATKDAEDLGAVLRSPDAGGFDRVFVIHGAAATTRAGLENAIRVATADLQRDDTFLLYLSGHGTLTLDPLEGSRLWILPSDGRLEDPTRTGLAVADLEELVNGLPARRRVLVLDTCHSGRAGSKSSLGGPTAQLVEGLRGEVPAPRTVREVAESEARLFAAQYYQPAMEDPSLQNGVYTHFLVESLTGGRASADLSRDGLVDVGEAHQYARDRTIAYTGGLQVPRAEYRIVGREDIYLSGRRDTRTAAERALVSAYDHLLDRARILVDGTPRGDLPGLVALDPGPALIEIETADGRRLLREHVRLDPGRTLSLEELVRARESAVELLAGAGFTGGREAFHPVGLDLQVGWVRPFAATSTRWRPDLHARVGFASGALADNQGRATTTGAVGGGATWAWDGGPVYLGPTADLRLPWRVDVATGTAQLGPGAAGGLTAGVELDAGPLLVDLRADAQVDVTRFGGEWTPGWGGAVKLGVAR